MRFSLLSGLVLVLVFTSSCEKLGDVADGDERLLSIRRGNSDDPSTLDPGLADEIHTFNILVDMYEGLLAEGADGAVGPGVARSWEISDDGLTYMFELRQNARWSNGDHVTASDFVRALRRNASAETISTYAPLLEPIENFQIVNSGQASSHELGVIARSDYQLEIQLSRPAHHFLSILSLPIAFPKHESDLDDVSNGAFALFDYQPGGPLRLRKNLNYWDASSVEIDEVVYLPIVDTMTEFNMYRAGELDITITIPSEVVDMAVANYQGETRIAPTLALYYLAFDLSEAPFDNKSLRQALSMALDREQIAEIIGRGEKPAYNVVPPGVSGYVGASSSWALLGTGEREQLARDAYEHAGYSADRPLRITYVYDTDDVHESIALVVASMWKEVLGVETTLEKREWKYFLDTRAQRNDWDIMRFAWFGDYNSANTFLDIFLSGNPQNLSGYQNQEYDRLLAMASSQIESERAAALAHDAEELLLDDFPIVPLYFYVSKHMVKPSVLGFETSVVDRHPSRFLKLVPE